MNQGINSEQILYQRAEKTYWETISSIEQG
jgi:hypothetical protein